MGLTNIISIQNWRKLWPISPDLLAMGFLSLRAHSGKGKGQCSTRSLILTLSKIRVTLLPKSVTSLSSSWRNKTILMGNKSPSKSSISWLGCFRKWCFKFFWVQVKINISMGNLQEPLSTNLPMTSTHRVLFQWIWFWDPNF